uniref:Wall-associated kinase n=1 Tax=Saccharum hybrid cultivar R570 TaxID=131158 RepID=A0A059Q194_9POAL|nr:wall-associated kinase [Saccharum hybrid cultivar R570]
MSGDGRKKGSGCYGSQKHFPLDTVLGVGLALMVTVTTAASCYCWAIKKRELGRKRAELFRKNGGLLLQQRFSTIASQGEDQYSAKIFSAEELKAATDNYSESRILGQGGHGTVYKGILPDQTIVAIKKSKVFDESQVEQFVNEIAILSQIDHPNVVKLLGCCLETQVPLLVYEFIPNGTLLQHIHNRNATRPLTWEDCLRIAAETADALAYLHSTSSVPIIHRDIKSSNILLDENFVAKIADFGASRSVPFDQTHITTLIQGTIGYLDPEYFQTSQLTEKSDVYSFGVVLAELLTRQKPISAARPEESCNLAMHLVVLFNEGRLLQEIEPHILAEAGRDQCYAVAELSVRCLNMKGEERPAMVMVASVLHGLRRSFTIDQTAARKDESVRKNSEQEEKYLHESIPIPSLQSSEVTNQVFRYAKKCGASYINKPKMRHYAHCYALHCLDEEASNALRRAYKARGENVGAWRQACYAPLVDIAARHGFDIDAVFAAHPRLAIWYVPTRLRQLCHQARGSHAHAHAAAPDVLAASSMTWRQACYAPLVDIAARHGFDIDAVFAAHPRLAI